MSDIFSDNSADGDEMSRLRPISDATADFLLGGGEVDDPAAQALAQVLAAASAPGRAEELAGEDVVLAAFEAAHLATSPAHRRRPMIKSMLANALGLKLAAAALAAAAGGLVLAASTGVLPDALYPGSDSNTPGQGGTTPWSPDQTRSPGWQPSAGPEQVGWCKAYLNAGSAEEKNKRLTVDLVRAAGGADNVDEYCAAVTKSPNPKPKPTAPSPQPKPDVTGTVPPRPSASPPEPDPSRKIRPTAHPTSR